MGNWSSALTVSYDTVHAACLLTVEGVLDGSTYLQLRDTILKAALDEPSAVLVDVNALDIPAESAWAVFTSARWHVNRWPDIPVVVVCASARRRDVARRSMSRAVPVYAAVGTALSACAADRQPTRRRAAAELPASLASLRRARILVRDWLTDWSQPQFISVATVITNVFVENVLQHANSALVLALEFDGVAITVAVHDDSRLPPARHEDPYRGGAEVSGLAIVASLCRDWGNAPTASGKTVWALIGPENTL